MWKAKRDCSFRGELTLLCGYALHFTAREVLRRWCYGRRSFDEDNATVLCGEAPRLVVELRNEAASSRS
jgi:hypothetical protein